MEEVLLGCLRMRLCWRRLAIFDGINVIFVRENFRVIVVLIDVKKFLLTCGRGLFLDWWLDLLSLVPVAWLLGFPSSVLCWMVWEFGENLQVAICSCEMGD